MNGFRHRGASNRATCAAFEFAGKLSHLSVARMVNYLSSRKASYTWRGRVAGRPQDGAIGMYHLPTSFNDPSCEAGKEI